MYRDIYVNMKIIHDNHSDYIMKDHGWQITIAALGMT